jgi:hypothetical protein
MVGGSLWLLPPLKLVDFIRMSVILTRYSRFTTIKTDSYNTTLSVAYRTKVVSDYSGLTINKADAHYASLLTF